MFTKNFELDTIFSKVIDDNNLTISKQEVVKHIALGLDEEKRNLIVVQQTTNGKFDCRIVNLDKIKNHFVKKTYGNINANDLKHGILEEYLEKIALYIELADNKQPFEIVFYNHHDHNIFELPELEQSARNWEVLVSKSLMYKVKFRNTLSNYNSLYWQEY